MYMYMYVYIVLYISGWKINMVLKTCDSACNQCTFNIDIDMS